MSLIWVVTLAKYGIDYSDCQLKGFNFAVGPQTLEFDFKMLKQYYGHLSYMGKRVLLLVFCPFGTCKSEYTESDGEVYKNVRYYQLLPPNDVPNFDMSLLNSRTLHPVKYAIKSWKSILINAKSGNQLDKTSNPYSDEQMAVSAENYIRNWKKEFSLIDLNPDNLSEYVKDALSKNRIILDDISTFCIFHEIHPYIVLPPLSIELNSLIPNDFRVACTYSVLKRDDIPLLDYSQDKRFCKKEFFLDALKLNKTGRRLFTKQLINDILLNNI